VEVSKKKVTVAQTIIQKIVGLEELNDFIINLHILDQ
jgi:hypothetical protein